MAIVKITCAALAVRNLHAIRRQGRKYLCLILLGLLGSLSCHATAAPKTSNKELVLAKQYVLAACIVDRYPGTPLANEADAWAAALVEDGNLPAAAYLTLTKLAKTAPTPQATQNGVVLRLENCVNFVEQSDVVSKIKQAMRRSSQ